MKPKWSNKFQFKPGKWVFVPTVEMAKLGKEIKQAIEDCWEPPRYFYHLRAGGHVRALRAHLGHSTFVRLDIHDFFGSINKNRITRCLKSKFGHVKAREWANQSTVPDPAKPKRPMVPFGFIQSPIVASLCLDESALGSYLRTLSKNKKVAVSVYVDDIIVSSEDADALHVVLSGIQKAAERAGFTFSAEKTQGPAPAIKAFNVELTSGSMRIGDDRIQKFVEALKASVSRSQRGGIIGYITSVNADQGIDIAALSSPAP